jgi:para-nitrobenzyl esterase
MGDSKQVKISGNSSERLERYAITSRLLAVAVVCVFTLGPVGSASAKHQSFPKPFAITQSGPVLGMTVNGIDEYLGIPYAKPPSGALRWMPPVSFGKFSAPLQANQFGSACTQSGPIGSEDCLFLNVYTPANAGPGGSVVEQADDEMAELPGSFLHGKPEKRAGALPVMVWIHGGGLTAGAGELYDPTPLVNGGGVIVVTINYRLGVLGFLAQSGLDAENHLLGNYGFMDQQFALEWVRKNIKAFGGNPKEVTIFGESAGGQSVYSQLASPLAKGLFRGAIAESGSYVEFQDYFSAIETLKTAETTNGFAPSGNSVANSVGCSSQTAACLRTVSADALVAAQVGVVYPFVDGKLLTQTPSAAFASGKFNRVPVIAGTNHDEYRSFVAAEYDGTGNPIDTLAEYDAAVTALWTGRIASAVEGLYPYASYPNGGLALSASGTDGVFSCPARNADKSLSKFTKTYAYEFNDENAPPGTIPGLSFPLGAFHGAEIQYLMLVAGEIFTFTTDQQALSDTMISYWTQFAKTLNPNSSGQPTWSSYSASTDQFQSLVPPTPMPETNFNTFHNCDSFWNTF